MSIPATEVAVLDAAPAPTPSKRARLRFLRGGKTLTGLSILGFFTLLAIIGPWIAPYDPDMMSDKLLQPPSGDHWFGTTQTGQDVLSQILVGTRGVLLVGFVAGFFATVLSVLIGVTSGFLGGVMDEVLSALSNIFLVIPALPLIIIIASFVSDAGDLLIAVVIAFTSWTWGARVLRAQTLSLRKRDYVEAARATGEPTWRIVGFEIMPNLTAVIASGFVGTVIFAVLLEITLAFIGVADISNWNWGTVLFWAQSNQALAQGAWWWFVPAGLCIALLGTALALINFGIDEFVNPRLRTETGSSRTIRMRVGFTPVARTDRADGAVGTKRAAAPATNGAAPVRTALPVRRGTPSSRRTPHRRTGPHRPYPPPRRPPRPPRARPTARLTARPTRRPAHDDRSPRPHHQRPQRRLRHRPRRRPRAARHRPHPAPRRGPGPGRRVGLGQVHARVRRHPAALPARSDHRRRRPLPAARRRRGPGGPAGPHAAGVARLPLAGALDRLPGRDELLNPVHTVHSQLTDVLRAHRPDMRSAQRTARAEELLTLVGISRDRLGAFPHQLSGGMRQRVMIAMALALEPEIVIMDEPTTALDVVMQRQILRKLVALREELGFSVVFITHDISLLVEFSDRIAIMYGGRIVEEAGAAEIYRDPRHPYSDGLLHSFPALHGPRRELTGIPGSPPHLTAMPTGCAFHPRCGKAFDPCAEHVPVLSPPDGAEGRTVACWLHRSPPASAFASDTVPEPAPATGPARDETTRATAEADAGTNPESGTGTESGAAPGSPEPAGGPSAARSG